MKKFYPFCILISLVYACSNGHGDKKSKYVKAAEEIVDKLPSAESMNAGKNNYTLFIPDGWSTSRQEFKGINYYFLLAPKTADDPNTNMNMISEDMGGHSLNVYLEISMKYLKQAIPDAEILGQGNIRASNVNGRWYSYTMAPQGIKTTVISYVFPKEGVAYILTGGTQPKDFKKHKPTFEKVARSLTFTD